MRYKPAKQLFKKVCTRCGDIYKPSGKYNKLCPKCLSESNEKRKQSLAIAAKTRKQSLRYKK